MYVYICWRFSRLITEIPVQGKSIWQNIPDFVTIPKTQFDQMIPTKRKWQNILQIQYAMQQKGAQYYFALKSIL